MSGAAAVCSGSAAATRCSAARSPIRTASRVRPATVAGLGLLDVGHACTGDKRLASGDKARRRDGVPFAGYEMHIGRDQGPGLARGRCCDLADGTPEGAVSANGRVIGLLYPRPVRRRSAARGVAVAPRRRPRRRSPTTTLIESTLDRLAKHLDDVHRSRPAAQPWRDDGERKRRHKRDQDRVGAPVELERRADVLRVRCAAAVAHPRAGLGRAWAGPAVDRQLRRAGRRPAGRDQHRPGSLGRSGGLRSLVRDLLTGIEVLTETELHQLPTGRVALAMPDPQAGRLCTVPDPVPYSAAIAVGCGYPARDWPAVDGWLTNACRFAICTFFFSFSTDTRSRA